jgi:preprotein translocase subunit SecA
MAGQIGQITIATNMAGRGTDIILGEGVKEVGGLHVLGTERHESQRVDNQLKGRAGRQGDPGSSQFIVSLEDDIVIRFAEEELEKVLKSIQPDPIGEIHDKKVLNLFDRVQRICEGNNYSIREYTLKLDDVVSEQRNVIYDLRNRLFLTEDILLEVEPMLEEWVNLQVERYCSKDLIPEELNLTEFEQKLKPVLPNMPSLPAKFNYLDELQAFLSEHLEAYKAHLQTLREDEMLQSSLKTMVLFILDQQWTDHLEAMEHLKEGIGLRSYAQLDPLIMYQEDGLKVFHETYQSFLENTLQQLGSMVY